jgi:hypothetical protein
VLLFFEGDFVGSLAFESADVSTRAETPTNTVKRGVPELPKMRRIIVSLLRDW